MEAQTTVAGYRAEVDKLRADDALLKAAPVDSRARLEVEALQAEARGV
jgi:hypothetical protein